jgi:hypothetical protein
LAAVRLVGDHDDVRAGRENRVAFAVLGAELLDQREDIEVVFFVQHPPQTHGALRANPLLVFEQCAGVGEVAVDLPVQVFPVGDDHEGPVARNLPQRYASSCHTSPRYGLRNAGYRILGELEVFTAA